MQTVLMTFKAVLEDPLDPLNRPHRDEAAGEVEREMFSKFIEREITERCINKQRGESFRLVEIEVK